MITLGDKVRDKVTGFTGVAVTRAFHLDNCVRIVVEPPVQADGKIGDPISFDEARLEVVGKGEHYVDIPEEKKTGAAREPTSTR